MPRMELHAAEEARWRERPARERSTVSISGSRVWAAAGAHGRAGGEELETPDLFHRREGAKVRGHPLLLFRRINVTPRMERMPSTVIDDAGVEVTAGRDRPVDEYVG